MIPKVIHYCWFGGKEKPAEVERCIASWRKYCPDYEIKEWNETNFDLNCCAYVKEAYEAKYWAFVSDVARFWILYHYGGLYFDTDVELIKPLDVLVARGSFMGKEGEVEPLGANAGLGLGVAPGLGLGVAPGFSLYREILQYYEQDHFLDSDGQVNRETVVTKVTNILKKYGYRGNYEVEYVDGVYIYPPEYFCPQSFDTGKITITKNTYSIHHFTASWFSPHKQRMRKFYQSVNLLFGVRWGKRVARPIHIVDNLGQRFAEYGMKKTFRYYRNRMHEILRG